MGDAILQKFPRDLTETYLFIQAPGICLGLQCDELGAQLLPGNPDGGREQPAGKPLPAP